VAAAAFDILSAAFKMIQFDKREVAVGYWRRLQPYVKNVNVNPTQMKRQTRQAEERRVRESRGEAQVAEAQRKTQQRGEQSERKG